ncbi:MAG: hypothetical protein HY683_10205 [Chloroflexi bacterium]|nr:hypothetical protein [Chloroflexota bacterium]
MSKGSKMLHSGAFPFVLPLAVALIVGAGMLGLGALFTAVGEGGTIAVGLAIIVGTGVVGYLLTRGEK